MVVEMYEGEYEMEPLDITGNHFTATNYDIL